MTRFRQATRTQIVLMTAGWLGTLLAIDYVKNPHLRASERMPDKAPPAAISLWINHLCCTGCLGEVRDALASVPWIDALCDAVEAHPKACIYAGLAGFTRAFAQVETQGLAMLE